MEEQPLPSAPSLGTTFMGVFTSPSEVFQSLKGTASAPLLWVIPLIVTIVLGIAITVTMFTNETLHSQIIDTQRQAMEKRVDEGKMSRETADQAINRMESGGSGLFIAIGSVSVVVMICLFFFLGALFLWLANKTLFKSTAGYGKYLELYGIASWIGALGAIISLLMMVGLGSLYAHPSGALLVMSNYDTANHLHKLLNALNIFSIWQTAVVGIGLAKFSEKSIGTGIGVAFVLWAVWVAIQVFLGFGM